MPHGSSVDRNFVDESYATLDGWGKLLSMMNLNKDEGIDQKDRI